MAKSPVDGHCRSRRRSRVSKNADSPCGRRISILCSCAMTGRIHDSAKSKQIVPAVTASDVWLYEDVCDLLGRSRPEQFDHVLGSPDPLSGSEVCAVAELCAILSKAARRRKARQATHPPHPAAHRPAQTISDRGRWKGSLTGSAMVSVSGLPSRLSFCTHSPCSGAG